MDAPSNIHVMHIPPVILTESPYIMRNNYAKLQVTTLMNESAKQITKHNGFKTFLQLCFSGSSLNLICGIKNSSVEK